MVLSLALASLGMAFAVSSTTSLAKGPPSPLHVEGVKVFNAAGNRVILRGVNIACMEWSSDGEGHVLKTTEVAIKDWNVNHIRLPLSQDRWFGKASDQKDNGKAYRDLVRQVVELCSANGVYCMLDLHWSSPNEWGKHIGQHIMPDGNSLVFWLDCARAYKNHPAVIFDLYNEPHDTTWEIWKNGGMIDEQRGVGARQGAFTPIKYRTPGMQALMNAVRSTGAKNLVVVGGLDWAYDLRGVLDGYEITDPGVPASAISGRSGARYDEFGSLRPSNLGAPDSDLKGNGILYACHNYPFKGDTHEQWMAKMRAYTAKLPVIVSEFGAQNRGATVNDPNPWVAQVLAACQENEWMWTAWDLHPAAGPTLISDWNYTPTPSFGKLVKEALGGR